MVLNKVNKNLSTNNLKIEKVLSNIETLHLKGEITNIYNWKSECNLQRYRIDLITSINFVKEYKIKPSNIISSSLTFRNFKNGKSSIMLEIPKGTLIDLEKCNVNNMNFPNVEYMILSSGDYVNVSLFVNNYNLTHMYNNQVWDLVIQYIN